MRIIGGRLRGKALEWASDGVTRPTTDRVKENVFNILANSGRFGAEMRVLDLFAGSGQIGVECISRWGASVVFNDLDAKSRGIIERNLGEIGAKVGAKTAKMGGKTPGAGRHPLYERGKILNEVLGLGYMECLEVLGERGDVFDLVYVDAPFADKAAPIRASEYLREHDMISPNGVVVVECEAEGLRFDGFEVREKKYGRARIYFLTR